MTILNILVLLGFTQINQPIPAEYQSKSIESCLLLFELSLFRSIIDINLNLLRGILR